jgi:hypothetical protein
MLLFQIPGILSTLIIPLSLIGVPIGAVLLLALPGFSLVKWRPRKAASYLLAVALPILLWRPLVWTTDCIHLGLNVWLGLGELSAFKTLDGKWADYDWSTGLVSNGNTFLIYDSTNEIALPIEQHKLLANSVNQLTTICAGNVSHLIGYYYICTF